MDRLKICWKVHFWRPFLQRRPLTRRKIAIVSHHNPLFRSHCCSFLLKTCFWYVFVRVVTSCKRYKHTCSCFRTFFAHKHKHKKQFLPLSGAIFKETLDKMVLWCITIAIFLLVRGLRCKKGPQKRVFQQILRRPMSCRLFFQTFSNQLSFFRFHVRCTRQESSIWFDPYTNGPLKD